MLLMLGLSRALRVRKLLGLKSRIKDNKKIKSKRAE